MAESRTISWLGQRLPININLTKRDSKKTKPTCWLKQVAESGTILPLINTTKIIPYHPIKECTHEKYDIYLTY